MKTYAGILGLALLIGLSGCDGGGSSVEGTVSLGGRLVDRGSIDLLPTDGTAGVAARTNIADGKFQFPQPLKPGKYLVQVRWPQATGKKLKVDPDSPGAVDGVVDETKEAIPPQFNQQSTLKRELKAGRNVLTFEF